MVEIIKVERQDFQAALKKAEEIIRKGGLIIYPTDTLYGIGGNAFSENVVEEIREIKRTPPGKPYSVVMSNLKMIKRYCEVNDWQYRTMKKYLPGPFTFLLKSKIKLPVSDNPLLGVRIPDSPFAHQLAEVCETPIVATSANPAGTKPPCRLEEIDGKVFASVELAVDNGLTKFHEASAVVDLIEKKVVRKGVWEIELFGY
jgi:tRNA threonylcarbamoyl adenosine modification protein (Sua5/YciO/YrdC/YwlC family)